jgi:hypothetical protein
VGLCLAAAKCSYTEAEASAAHPLRGILRTLQSLKVFVSQFDVIHTMNAHAHLGTVGCFVMLIVGVSYKLIPMFTLSEVQSRVRAGGSVALLNVGLAGSFVTILLHSPWKLAFALVAIAALALYGWELTAILRARKRRPLDWGIKYFLTAVAMLLPVSALAIGLSWPGLRSHPFSGQLENAYGFLGLIGVVTFAIMGLLYKIIPFLVWFACYSGRIGLARVPALGEMYSTKLQAAGYWTWLAGLAITIPAIVFSNETVVRVGCGFLVSSVTTLLLNVGGMLAHFVRPQNEPLAAQPLTVPKPA